MKEARYGRVAQGFLRFELCGTGECFPGQGGCAYPCWSGLAHESV